MYRFLETICCKEGNVLNLDLHQERVNRTFNHFFPEEPPLVLNNILSGIPKSGKYKCRVEYSNVDFDVDFSIYTTPVIKSYKLVQIDSLDYQYKYADRRKLATAFAKRGSTDDIIMIRNGMVTDSYYANLAFFDENVWWTPKTPLLAGVMRASLIAKGTLQCRDIFQEEVGDFFKISFINAMLELDEVSIDL